MNPEQPFRFLLVVLFGLVIVITARHRLKARTDEPLDRRQEGVFILATLRPLAAVFYIAFFTYLFSPASMAWSSLPLPAAVRWAGLGIGLAGVGLLFWTLHRLGGNLTDTVVTRREHSLVTRGPYRWIRHPFYASMASFIVAVSLMAANWFLLLTGVLVVALLMLRTAKEEENLVARFGDDYRRYMARTGRLFPRIFGGRP
jgi:protein-S-isoprenylcysteine O-methyltransferase Ste14